MAPKPAAAQVPVAGGGVASGLRSAAKTASAPAKSSSASKVAPGKAAAAAKPNVTAKSAIKPIKSIKGKALPNTAPAASHGGRDVMSPPPSVNLFGEGQSAAAASKKKGKPKAKAVQPSSNAADNISQQPVELSLLNSEALFEMFVAEVPSFDRFRAQWTSIGSLSAQVVATQYEPETFVADIIRDLSTPTLNLDRPTAIQVASFFGWHVENDDSFPYSVRRPWVLLKCRLRREAIPELYSQATVDRYAKEAAADKKLKRKRVVDSSSGGSGEAAAAVQKGARQSSDDDDSSSSSSQSSEAASAESDNDDASDDDVQAFTVIQKQKDLNAVTVWGEKAGFSVIPHEQILQMLADKAAEISRRGHDAPRGVAVVFPKLTRWNKASWLSFERRWWVSINEAVENGSYSKIVSLIDLDLHVDIQLDLKLSATALLKCADVEFLRLAHGWFGPTDNEQAKLLLETHHCRDNGNGNPSYFLKSLSAYNTAVLRTLDIEIAPSVGKWPRKGERKHGPLTLKSIRTAFKNGFAADKSISAACKHCYSVCEQNPKWSHTRLYRELRDHFLEDERALQRSTMVGSKRGGSDGPDAGGRGNQGNQNKRQRGDNSGPQSAGGNPRDRGSKADRNSGTKPKQEHQFKIVKGADRGKVCGDYTNHYGKGCSAKTCIYFGTDHAKPKGYVWKDSDKEPKVTIDQQAFYDLKKSKPEVVKFNNDNREAYRTANKGQHYPSSSSAALDTLVVIDPSAGGKQLSTQQLVNHLGLAYKGAPPSAADLGELVAMDLVNVDTESCDTASPLKELGWSKRFYGVAAFLPALQPPASTNSNSETSCNCASLWFARDVQEGKYKRAARFTKGVVKPSSCVNVINASAVALASQYGKLKECLGLPPPSEIISDGRPYIHLQFNVAVGDKAVVTKTDWFVIDADNKQPDKFVVTLKATFATDHNISANAFELVPSSECTIANAAGKHPAPVVAVEHQQFIGKVFFDPGAQMSCISEHLVVPHLCLDVKTVNASIVQMGVVVAHCTNAVLLDFKLFDAQMQPVRYQEWFLVFNNPYGIIMGELFCQQFTTWRQLLASWDDANVHQQLELSAENFTGWMAQNVPEQGSNTSSPLQANGNATDAARFVSRHPVTDRPLRCRDAGSRPIIGSSDHANFRLNEHNVAAGVWTESSRRSFNASNCLAKEKRLYGLLEKLPKEARVAVDVAEMQGLFAEDQRLLCLRIQREIVGLPVGLMMGCGQSGIVRRSHLFEPYKPTLVSDDSAVVKALSPAMCFFVRDLIAAHIEALQTGRMRPWRADVEQKQYDNLEVAQAPQVKVNMPPMKPGEATPSFAPGTIIRFQNCSRFPQYNDKLGRLYDETEEPGVWRIRVLGKDGGQFVKSNTSHFVVHDVQRPFVSASDANFHDVGLDDAGMPIEAADDMPKPVHRQFGKQYSAELTAKIKEILDRFPQLFDGDISEQCTFEEMDIQLKPNAILPSKSRYYRNTPRMKEEVRRQVQEQLEMGIISKAQTAVVSNVLLVKRPHMPGRYRFVVDFRDVNEVTVPEMLMMPDIKSQHDRLSNKRIYGAVDISSYYRLIGLKKECRYLTGFATDEGTFVYNRVPMGVRNACSHAQRILQDALAADPVLGVQGANIRNYFDDIAWGSNTEEEFLAVLEALMQFGVTHKLKFNAEKSCFGVDSITHVGFVVSKDGVKIDPERTRDIVEMQAPKSTKKVQSVLGVLNFVRNFVPGFSLKAKFLTDRLEKAAAKRDEKKFIWSEDDERQFRELKELVVTAPLLSVLDYSAPIFIRCDSSRYGAGAVLFQYDNEGREVPVCYASRKYTATETRYSTFQQEMGAVVWALERFQEYCMGYPVIVETDHRNISYVKRSAMPQLARWRMRLEAFDFEVHYRCGALQQVADGLSRAACDEDGIDAVAVHYRDVLPECALANAAPAEALGIVHVDTVDVMYNEINSTLSSEWNSDQSAVHIEVLPISDDDVPPAIERDSDDDDDDDTGIQASDEISNPAPDLPWHDAAAVKDILNSVHNDLAGHGGVLVTLQRVLKLGKPAASRKQMIADIDAFLMGCVSCQKMRKRSSGSAVTRRVISGNPFEELSIDILKLPFPDAHGNMYVVTIVDNFSHWISTYACANKSAVCAVRALLQHIGVFGVPLRIRSDGGGEFCNDIVVQLTRLMGSAQMVVLPYAHTANGTAERANRSVLERLRFILFDRRIKKQPKLQWSDLLPLAQRIVNSSIHSAIGTSPSRLIFGDHVDIDRCILTKPATPLHNKLVVDYVQQLSDMQFAMMDAANDHQLLVQEKVVSKAEKLNRGKPQRQFQIGDLVLIKPLKDVPLHKLAPRELGPRTVVELNEGGILTLVDPHSLKRSKANEYQCELFDTSVVDSVEGQKIVAETDAFEFAVEAILAHGIGGDDDLITGDIMPLGPDHKRTLRPLNYVFLIKWAGYEQPTWVAYKAARLLPHFANYVNGFPNLRMGSHA